MTFQRDTEVYRGDIFYIATGGYVGSEQKAGRPGIIVSNDTANKHSPNVEVVFLENRCVRDESANIKAKDLYNCFKLWAKSEGAYVLSARKFNSEMERHLEWFDRKSTSSGFMIYWGLKLKEVV